MRINSINNINVNKYTNFNGLWGKTSSQTDIDRVIRIPSVVTTYYYFPFNNESQSDISAVKSPIDKAYVDKDAVTGRDKSINIEDCKICATLPFNDKEFEQYRNFGETSQLNATIKRIHAIARNKYVTKEYGDSQVSAFNAAVEKSINEEIAAQSRY